MKALDNLGNTYEVVKNKDTYSVRCADIPADLNYIDIIDETLFAKVGEEGYYVIADANKKGSKLCYFNQKEDGERVYKQDLMPIFGVKNENRCSLFIGEGYGYELNLVFGVRNGNYYIYPRFMLYGQTPYEDISLRVIELEPDSTYSDMAVAYRNYNLQRGSCLPLKEKMKQRKTLEYAANAPEIRIRMGWKPAPTPVLDQTPENEPEMKVACTFDRVCDLIDEMKAQGVDKAQICLVGWNKSGHDGRWPQIFPVEEKLGGEERLRHLIGYAKENGYQIVCHTNSTDCYSIADTYSDDIVVKKQDGSLFQRSTMWSGGRMYDLCPVKALEFAKKELPKVRDLGFEGLHYIDVMAVVPLRWCFDKNHPVNSKQTLACYNEIMEMCHDLFGGFSSEGTFDFSAKYLDYGLYVSRPPVEDNMVDKTIPFWQIAYHGITLYNSTTDTINFPIKDPKNHLIAIEDGTRPSFYIYSKFLKGIPAENWLGKEDLVCDTEEELKYTVGEIKKVYDEYQTLFHLQTEFIVRHEEKEENVFEVEYSGGTVITVDYNTQTYSVK